MLINLQRPTGDDLRQSDFTCRYSLCLPQLRRCAIDIRLLQHDHTHTHTHTPPHTSDWSIWRHNPLFEPDTSEFSFSLISLRNCCAAVVIHAHTSCDSSAALSSYAYLLIATSCDLYFIFPSVKAYVLLEKHHDDQIC